MSKKKEEKRQLKRKFDYDSVKPKAHGRIAYKPLSEAGKFVLDAYEINRCLVGDRAAAQMVWDAFGFTALQRRL